MHYHDARPAAPQCRRADRQCGDGAPRHRRRRQQFLRPQFADELYGPGQPLDIRRYWIILPDNIGHGKSSKPSDGLRMHFPKYDYDDMVEAQHRMLIEGLGVTHMRLIMGTSMGCMHSFHVGRDLSGLRQRADAAGLRADRDCGAQPHVAAAGDQRDRSRPGLARRQLRERADGGPAHRADPAVRRRRRAAVYQAQYPTRAAASAYAEERVASGHAGRSTPTT